MNINDNFYFQKRKLIKYVKISDVASYDKTIGSLLNIHDSFVYEDNIEMNRSMIDTPKIVATIYCSRKSGYYMFNAFFLIFLITSSALTIFAIDCKLTPNRLQISYTLLLTSISFKWVVNRSLPTVY